MKILLLDPQRDVSHRISKDTSGGYGTGNNFGNKIVPSFLKYLMKKNSNWPPMHAIYTYSALENTGHEIVYKENLEDDYNNFDLYIIVSSIVCCETEVDIIKLLKSENKKIFVIGPFATNNPDKYNDAGATIISGESEFYFLKNKDKDFNEDLKKKIVKFEHNFSIDDLPYPAWNKVIKNFDKVNNLFGRGKSVPILGTRGCPYSCQTYCVYPLQQGRKVRQRDPKKIVDEMEYWRRNFGITMFIFRDPVFSINKKHTLDFCKELFQRNLDIKFVIETHLRILDSDLIKELLKCGLKGVKVGVESANSDVLNDADRFTVSKDVQLTKIRELENYKIMVSAMFIIGFPTDTEETINKTINYAKVLNTSFAQFSVWTPYPGTPIFEKYKNKISVKKYESFDQYNLVYKHKLFNPNKIRFFLNRAYTTYYFRFSWIKKHLSKFL
jgi:anaerobic magnesium-protoporphyrin IX monomethyl ester cyclase